MPKFHTRENMSQELRDELERIEDHEQMLLVKSILNEAIQFPLAYLHTTFTTHSATSPFEVEFYWDEPEMGSILKMDFREDMLEIFRDDPEHYKEKIAQAEKAMRYFADELKQLLETVK